MSSSPVRDYKAFEAHDVTEVALQGLGIATRVNTVNLVIATHSRADACLDGCIKGWIVEFKISSLVDVFVNPESIVLLGVVSEVLDVGHHTVVLDSVDDIGSEHGSDDRIFT